MIRYFGFLPDQPPTMATIFSGGGLAESGFAEAGFEIVYACEIDPQARAVHRRHFPRAVMSRNVKEVHGRDIPPVDALFFGSPCQDLSVAGPRTGLAGERSGLFFEVMRIVDEMASPPVVGTWENVCGALASNGGRDFGTVLREMARRWRGVAWRVLDLQFFGVPQRRRRVYVVGHSGGWERAASILFEPDGLRWNPPARQGPGQAVACPVTAGSRKCDRGDVNQNLIAFGGNNTVGPIEVAARLGCNESGSGYRLDFESDTLVFDTTQMTSRANYSSPKFGNPCHPLAATAHAPALAFPANQSGTQCASTADLSPSLGAANPTAVAGPWAVRRLTPVECERLMGLPDGFTAWGIDDAGCRIELADSPRYKIIGNGVGRPHSKWLGRRMVADLQECGRCAALEAAS